MHSWMFRLIALSLVGLFPPAAISAQTTLSQPASTFSNLAPLLPPGATIVVTDQRGRRVKGELTVLSGQSLSLATGDGPLTFVQSDVSEVRRQISDRVLDGGLIGLVAGFAVPAAICAGRSDGSETAACTIGSLIFGGLPGFAIGAIVDAVRTRKVTVFRSSTGRPSPVTISPVIAPGGIALRASLRLGS